MSSAIFDISDRLLSAMVNGVLQGVIVCILVAAAVRFWPRTNAATRHAVWFGLLLLVAGLIPLNYLMFASPTAVNPQSGAGSDPQSVARNPQLPGFASQPAKAAPQDGTSEDIEYHLSKVIPFEEIAFTSQLPLETGDRIDPQLQPATSIEPPEDSFQTETKAQPPVQLPAFTPAIQSDAPGSFLIPAKPVSPAKIIQLQGLPRSLSLSILTIVAFVALARLVVLAWRLHKLRVLKASSIPPETWLAQRFESLCARNRIRRPVELRISAVEASPIVLGFFRPVILLPGSQQTRETRETDQILTHEVAHIRRNDDWLNLAQHTLQAILFFHPAVFWIGRQLSLEREIACDDYALQNDAAARSYALLLTDLAARVCKSRPLLAPGVSTGKSQLKQRIHMILNTNRNISPLLGKTRLGILATAATGCATLLLCGAPRLLLAQASQAAPPAPPAKIVSSGGVLFVAGEPAPVAVETTPEPGSEPQTPGVPPGAKSKDAWEGIAPVPPVVVVAPPTPPETPAPAGVAPRPFNFALTGPGPRPRGPRGGDDDSIEGRIARLEEMVRSLMEQQKQQLAHPDAPWGNRLHPKVWALVPDKPGFPDSGLVEQQAKEAAKQREKALKDAEHARAEAGNKGQTKRLEALRRMREDLQRQMDQLEREIDKLEQAKDRLQSELDRHQELLDQSEQEEEELAEQAAN